VNTILAALWLVAGISAAADPAATPETVREYKTAEESVVINEVQYHPASDDPCEEWIELFNRGKVAVDLAGWKLTGAVEFTFPAGARIEAGGFLVAGADAARIREAFSVENALGGWQGDLGDGGETIRLVSARDGIEVEAFAYDDSNGFPVRADGSGSSLERRDPHRTANNPANWGASVSGGWTKVQFRGTAPSNRLYFYLLGAGAVYVDDLTVRVDQDGKNLALSGGFEEARIQWRPNGNHSGSSPVAERFRSGKRSLKIVSTGEGGSRANSVTLDIPGLEPGQPCAVEFWVDSAGSRTPLVARFSNSARTGSDLSVQTTEGAAATPGEINSIRSETIPPLIHPVTHAPRAPGAADRIEIRAAIWTEKDPIAPVLRYDDGKGEKTSGFEPSADAPPIGSPVGSKLYIARVGPFPAKSVVRYRITARDAAGGAAVFPLEGNPTRSRGFYVQDPSIQTAVEVYQIFMSDAALNELRSDPFSDVYRPATFIHGGEVFSDVGVRYRGHTSRFIPKHHWKVKFNKDQPFTTPGPGRHKVRGINLNSFFGEKSYMREKLGYDLWRDMGQASCESWHARLYLNGAYFGLYLHLENPGEEYLERNRLLEGWLWKSYGEMRGPFAVYDLKAGDPKTAQTMLYGFIGQVNLRSGKPLESFLQENVQVDSLVDFLAGCQLIHSADHVQKNYLIYASHEKKVTFLPWDLDLTHGRNFECTGGGIWNDTIRHDLWDRENGDRELLFGTRSHPKCDGWVNGLIDAFLVKSKAHRPAYYRRTAELLARHYHPEVLVPKVERLREQLRAEVELDRKLWPPRGKRQSFDSDVDELVGWIEHRFEYLSEKLKSLGYPVGPPINAHFECPEPLGAAPLAAKFLNLSAGGVESFKWEFGDGATSTEREPTHVFREPRRYDVSLTVTGPAGSHTILRRDCVHALR